MQYSERWCASARSVPELLVAGLALEMGAVDYLRVINHCARRGTKTTRSMIEEMVRDEEQHADLFETQLDDPHCRPRTLPGPATARD